jgi:hypothetical protein
MGNQGTVENLGTHWKELSVEALEARLDLALTIMKVMERVCRELNDMPEAKTYAHCYDMLATGKTRKVDSQEIDAPKVGAPEILKSWE